VQQQGARLVFEDRADQLALAELAADAVGRLGETRRERAGHFVGFRRQIPGRLDEKPLAIGEHDEADSGRGGEALKPLLETLIVRRGHERRGHRCGRRCGGRRRDRHRRGCRRRRRRQRGGQGRYGQRRRRGSRRPVDGLAPLEGLASKVSIFRTRSSTPNGLNITASDRTSAARAWTVPLSIPEIRRTGVAPMAGCARTYWQT